MGVHYLGIRHHGPGSAGNVRKFLEKERPDIILLEGPPEAEPILNWAAHADMKPPVAILAYVPEQLDKSVFYPFAAFSPEWQAILYASENKIPLRFMDLPVAHQIAFEEPVTETVTAETEEAESIQVEAELIRDPFMHLARISGYEDGEKWWENHFEDRHENEGVFDAVREAVAVLRETEDTDIKQLEKCREAWMRKTIRQAEKEMFSNIVVVCGAWHVPALQNPPKQKDDNELLKGLPKVKVECTWVPWSYSRLSFTSGYGAGINSPGWYDHIWKTKEDRGLRWLTKVAKLFRKQQLDISSAHIIEAFRLAETLSYLRGFPKPGLEELNEATRSIMCMGDDIMMSVIHRELIVSPRIGAVPAESPRAPLQVDITRIQKQLRLPMSEEEKEIVLDLREERDLLKSIFLHRLSVLGIGWGIKKGISGKGTFKEAWTLQWDPSFSISIIDKGIWGNTVEEACNNFLVSTVEKENSLRVITLLLGDSLMADLPRATERLLNKVNNLAAASADVIQLMEALPALVSTLRYGNVRMTDKVVLNTIVDAMISRICVSLPSACLSVDEDAARVMLELFFQLNDAVSLLQNEVQLSEWQSTLLTISGIANASPLLAGFATRLVYDYRLLDSTKLATLFSMALSPAVEYAHAASWLEGFLKGSGTVLLIDDDLWNLVNQWVGSLDEKEFIVVLPLLRRTFSQYSQPERRKLGEKARHSGTSTKTIATDISYDHESGMKALPAILQLFGINNIIHEHEGRE